MEYTTNDIEKMSAKLAGLKKRIEEIEKKKIEAETELRFTEQQFDKYVEELKALGVDDVNDLPKLIEQAVSQINEDTIAVEASVTLTETKLKTA